MTWDAEQIFGKQAYTGGERVEEYRTPQQLRDHEQWAARRTRYSHWRLGKLHRIDRSGGVLHSQAVRWDGAIKRGQACRLATTATDPRTWLTPRVSSVDHTRGGDCVEFVAGGVRYRLELAR